MTHNHTACDGSKVLRREVCSPPTNATTGSNQSPAAEPKESACAPKPISRESQRVLDESITWVRATEEEIIRRWQLEHANDEFPAEVSETTGKRRPDKSQLTKYHKQRRLKGPSKVVIRLDYTRVPKHRSTGVLVPEGAVSSPATSSTPTATNFIPVGEPYYKLLRASWTGEAGAAVPPNSKVGPVDAPVFYGNDQGSWDSFDDSTWPPFPDPVPLDAMLGFLHSEWESEGLYAA